MTHEEIIAMAREAGFDMSRLPSIRAANVYGEVNDELARFAALVAAKERERLFGKAQHDGEMRLMLHRWEGGRCFAAAAHFSAEQTHFGPNDLLQMAVDRLDDRLAAGIAEATRAQEQEEGA